MSHRIVVARSLGLRVGARLRSRSASRSADPVRHPRPAFGQRLLRVAQARADLADPDHHRLGRLGSAFSSLEWGSACASYFRAIVNGLDVAEIAVVLVGIPALLATQMLQGLLLAEGRMVAYNGAELGMAVVIFVGLALVLLVFSLGILAALVLYGAVNFAERSSSSSCCAATSRGSFDSTSRSFAR